MAQSQGWVRRYFKAFCKGFFVAVPVAVTFLDRVACVARVEGASMQPSLNPGGSQSSDVVLLNHWKVRNFEVQRGDIVSLVSPKNPEQKIIKRVIALEGDIIRTIGHKNRYVKVPRGHMWVEGDHHGHSFDSNSFGPEENKNYMKDIVFTTVSLGLLHALATHILWPPERWQKLESVLPPERFPVQSEEEE
ncbi:mitochondrial inner membrane protease subunit 2 isoform X1 [Nannospalax galili]|nr:mitochondrial inner membrane protease subunit 2 isoform X1 [Nannospalax galili]XP_029417355.1 mitochondrial inner membrane protease subunit 2 isoform X1 [Nannospalax galili]XP_029417356.1 mitochondrial inner membrane protease subunit 2 isoform X1 [Nannospalax galili]XP_029417357.1 mitochondrial inner membrane protease subunit 2 isoform X1 [Nannospalax galili]XP_029417358.1 mitochondrial inner membrane protease subunit 2 isoform X1 [Nannospalax galili]XP_029417359.1 mitochondrial inner membr